MKNAFLLISTALLLAPAAFAQNLTTEKFSDGSGQIGVAAGWKLADAGKGAALLNGPGGASMMLGMPLFVFSKNYDRMTLTPGVNPEVPRVRFDSAVSALIDVLNQAARQGAISGVKLKAVMPAEGFPGKASFISYRVVFQGKPMEVFGIYAIMPTDAMSGTFYSSAIQAPPDAFAKRLPEMMAMWKSWNLSPKLVQERLDNARKIIAEADIPGKLDEIQQGNRRAALEAARKFQGYIRE
jgi:hypothetical protein